LRIGASLTETSHHDVGAYVLGALLPEERHSFERHLESCEVCRRELAGLEDAAGLLECAGPPYALPESLKARTFAAIEREATANVVRLVPQRRRWTRVAAIAATGAVTAVAFVAGSQLNRTDGTLELTAMLSAPRGPAQASVEVRKTGIGRVIRFESDRLPILPKGDYYELWFVGPGDTRERPNRISAGTFHPDEQGRSRVRFAAAVDPAEYPVLSVTAEPGDGNPERTGPEVLGSKG
jgi:anti-sigma-K factor RskA